MSKNVRINLFCVCQIWFLVLRLIGFVFLSLLSYNSPIEVCFLDWGMSVVLFGSTALGSNLAHISFGLS